MFGLVELSLENFLKCFAGGDSRPHHQQLLEFKIF